MTQTVIQMTEASCTECGADSETVHMIDRSCNDCGIRGCDCVLVEDAHRGDVYWCTDCDPGCGCYYCTGDN
jgi:hypothetical protein